MVVTVLLGYVVFGVVRASAILTDAFWSSVFAANWRFVAVGTDYMHASDSLSPLQHYWSLSVEEQFYLLWPAILVLTFALVSRAPRRTIFLTAVFVTLASLGWAVWETAHNPTWAYFSTFSRAWELGVGAMLACAAPVLEKLPTRFRPWLVWLGLGTLAASAVLMDVNTAFPAPWAIVPVVATGAILVAGIGAVPKFSLPLTNPVSVYLGTISYSLYLWHLPVIVFTSTFLGQQGEKYLLLSSALIFSLAVLSYHFIEDPLRHASWSLRRKRFRLSRSRKGLVAVPALAAVIVVMMLATYFNRLPAAVPQREVSATSLSGLFTPAATTPLQVARAAAVSEALATTEWPTLTPSIDELGRTSRASEWTTDGCLGLEASSVRSPEERALGCVYGDPAATHSIAVLGDSVAISYVPALREAIGPDWKIHVFTMSQCPYADVETLLADKSPNPMCDEFRSWSLDQIQALQPDKVVLSGTVSAIERLASGAKKDAATSEFEQGLKSTFDRLSGIDVVVLDAPPDMTSLAECAVLGSLPADCVRSPKKVFVTTNMMVRRVAAAYPGVSAPATLGWFCDKDGFCPAFTDSVPTMADGAHLSEEASKSLASLVGEAVALN